MESKNIFSRFDKEFDVKGLKEDLKNVGSGDSHFREVPFGTYEVRVERLELVESKTGKPMLSCWMKILSGEYENSILFMNQVVNAAFGLHIANEFLRSLESGVEVGFESFLQYQAMILDIHEAIDGNYEYTVKYGGTNKGYRTYKITEIFEAK
jgi:hypothetical protein